MALPILFDHIRIIEYDIQRMKNVRHKETSAFLKIIAHETRLLILEELSKGMKCVHDIEEILDVRQPNISQHLTILRHGGLVSFNRKGKKRCYFLTDMPRIRRVLKALQEAR